MKLVSLVLFSALAISGSAQAADFQLGPSNAIHCLVKNKSVLVGDIVIDGTTTLGGKIVDDKVYADAHMDRSHKRLSLVIGRTPDPDESSAVFLDDVWSTGLIAPSDEEIIATVSGNGRSMICAYGEPKNVTAPAH